jgi:phosphoribosylamine--glycine ligase
MYGGFIKTKIGVRLIEFNARFGDPEAMNLIPLLETDLVDIFMACVNQTLDKIEIKFKEKASVCLYVVPSNYPDGQPLSPEQKQITLNKEVFKIPNLYTFFSSVDLLEETETEYILTLSSSRALAFTALSDTIEEARQLALQSMQFVSGSIAYRTDIGSKELIQKRINLL